MALRLPHHLLPRPILFLTLILAACAARTYGWHGTAYETPPTAAPLLGTLPSSSPNSSIPETGVPHLVYFGYTQCPDFCPATLGIAADVFEQLGDEAERVRFYFVTVDPERDTREVLTEYLDGFDSRFIGVRPEAESLPALLAAYGATAFVDPAHPDSDSGVIAHTTRLFLVDKDGLLRAHYPFDTSAEDLMADVRHLLQDG